MAYADVPSAVGMLRPAAAPRLALAAPQPGRRRALELLASCRDGCTEALMRTHGFSIEDMVELVRAGPTSATAERVAMGARAIEVARMKMIDVGRRALAKRG